MQAPEGFLFSTAAAGFKYTGRDDLALLISAVPAVAAGVFTTNRFQAAPVLAAREALQESSPDFLMRGVLINAGQANACTGDTGLARCKKMLELTGQTLEMDNKMLLPASTGVIGAQLDMDRFEKALPALKENLGRKTPVDMARAIMTTDTVPKIADRSCSIEGKEVRITGFCKGSGMICPNMATMLACVCTDAELRPALWQQLFATAVDKSFNAVTVDGDTSTNDTVFGLANGASGVRIEEESAPVFQQALQEVCTSLASMIIADAEGGSKVCHITVSGAVDSCQAELAARAVAHSPLVKTALYGQDANWGRIACALGYSGASFRPEKVCIRMGGVEIFRQGEPVAMDIDAALADHLQGRDITLAISLGAGNGSYELLTADLSHDYVSINADYRS